MYALIYASRIFREYSVERSKLAVALMESRQQSTIHLPGRDVKTSNINLVFEQKNRFLLEISTTLNIIGWWFSIYFKPLSPL